MGEGPAGAGVRIEQGQGAFETIEHGVSLQTTWLSGVYRHSFARLCDEIMIGEAANSPQPRV
jgi:hypothetical protein